MKTLIPQNEFLEKYRIDVDAFNATTISWAELEALFNNYVSKRSELEGVGESMSNQLMKVEKVHSVRYRIKDEEHLIAKVIRKRIDNKERIITTENYLSEITDLVGLRAIHLFKEDWISIHEAIIQTWNLKEDPKAYIRAGDNELYRKAFSDKGLNVEDHKRGYRSIHYTAITKPAKIELFIEVQVRTIFEEGWSEIDHNVRYPYELDNLLYREISLILNRLAGSADELGSFITLLRNEITEHKKLMLSKQEEIEKLQVIIDKSNMNDDEKDKVKQSLAETVSVKPIFLSSYQRILPTDFSSSIAEIASTITSIQNFPDLSGLMNITPSAALMAKAVNQDLYKGSASLEKLMSTITNHKSPPLDVKNNRNTANPKAAQEKLDTRDEDTPENTSP